jgi:hypothetical protein
MCCTYFPPYLHDFTQFYIMCNYIHFTRTFNWNYTTSNELTQLNTKAYTFDVMHLHNMYTLNHKYTHTTLIITYDHLLI